MSKEQIEFANKKFLEQMMIIRQMLMEDEEKKLIEAYELLLSERRHRYELALRVFSYKWRDGLDATTDFNFSTPVGGVPLLLINQQLSRCIYNYEGYRSILPPSVVLPTQFNFTTGVGFSF